MRPGKKGEAPSTTDYPGAALEEAAPPTSGVT
jgi:hypothetical protein